MYESYYCGIKKNHVKITIFMIAVSHIIAYTSREW